MSDQQLVTGAALLASGYSQLHCGISAFHWQVMIYLVWYSSFTYLATLTVLRRYFKNNKPMRWWRVRVMFLIVTSLIAALIPTANEFWLPPSYEASISNYTFVGMPAQCFFHISNVSVDPRPFSSMLISSLVLLSGYVIQAIKLFTWTSEHTRLCFRENPGNAMEKELDNLYAAMQAGNRYRWLHSIPYWSFLTILATGRALCDLAESMAWEVRNHFLRMYSAFD